METATFITIFISCLLVSVTGYALYTFWKTFSTPGVSGSKIQLLPVNFLA